jgi:hypothetical protein
VGVERRDHDVLVAVPVEIARVDEPTRIVALVPRELGRRVR